MLDITQHIDGSHPEHLFSFALFYGNPFAALIASSVLGVVVLPAGTLMAIPWRPYIVRVRYCTVTGCQGANSWYLNAVL